MKNNVILFSALKLSPVAQAMLKNLAEARKTTESEAAIFLLNTCAMVERERRQEERVPYVAEPKGPETINLVIAGSKREFDHYLRSAIIEKVIAEEDKGSYIYIYNRKQLIGLTPSKVKLHYWGNYSQNPVMNSDEHKRLRHIMGLV